MIFFNLKFFDGFFRSRQNLSLFGGNFIFNLFFFKGNFIRNFKRTEQTERQVLSLIHANIKYIKMLQMQFFLLDR